MANDFCLSPRLSGLRPHFVFSLPAALLQQEGKGRPGRQGLGVTGAGVGCPAPLTGQGAGDRWGGGNMARLHASQEAASPEASCLSEDAAACPTRSSGGTVEKNSWYLFSNGKKLLPLLVGYRVAGNQEVDRRDTYQDATGFETLTTAMWEGVGFVPHLRSRAFPGPKPPGEGST